MDPRHPSQPDEEVRFGLTQLQRYLGGEVAPMMVADSIEPQLGQPPDLVIPVTRTGWSSSAASSRAGLTSPSSPTSRHAPALFLAYCRR